MIVINLSSRDLDGCVRLEVKGHAGQAEHGKDIVCSAVSILTYTAAQLIKEMEAYGMCLGNPEVEMNSGNAVIKAEFSKFTYVDALKMLHVITTGYSLLQARYPEYVKLIIDEA